MTTYGTIPTISLPPPSQDKRQFVSLAKERIEASLGTRQPWNDMINLPNLSLPSNLAEAIQRIKSNSTIFRTNYAIIVTIILFLNLLWHPVSLIFFIVTVIGWLFLYFLRDEPLVVLGRRVGDGVVTGGLVAVSVVGVFVSDVGENLVVGLCAGIVVVMVHGALREADNLLFVDEQVVGSGEGDLRKAALRNAASSSFSLPA
ncbi:hypothetical protein UlMin_022091 [Ulmus minor]